MDSFHFNSEFFFPFQFLYQYQPDFNGVYIQPKSTNYEIYSHITQPIVAVEEYTTTFIAGNTIFDLSKDSEKYTITYYNVDTPDKYMKEELNTKQKYYVGRAPEQLEGHKEILVENDAAVSRCHVSLVFNSEKGGWIITDNTSSNGTYIKIPREGSKINWKTVLRVGKDAYLYFDMEEPQDSI